MKEKSQKSGKTDSSITHGTTGFLLSPQQNALEQKHCVVLPSLRHEHGH